MSESPSWTREKAKAVYNQSLPDLIFQAQSELRAHFDPNRLQGSQLLSVKTGGCPEDCGYCSQSAFAESGLKASKLMDVDDVIAKARAAKAGGAGRFCMGAAWRDLKDRDLPKVGEMIRGVKNLGMETCATFGMLTPHQAESLADAGLDYYNHNVDSSEGYYEKVTSTRVYQDRLDTLACARKAGMKLCCGGILGLGETEDDRIDMLVTLANLETPPESVPINSLVPVPGTRMADNDPVSAIEFVRCIALARIMMPRSYVRLSAGRGEMSDELQALCFLAGANSIFVGDELLTTPNPEASDDRRLMGLLGLAFETDPVADDNRITS